MSPSFPKLVDVSNYKAQHTTYFGWPPKILAVSFADFKLLRAEAKQYMRYTQASQPIVSLSIDNVLIYPETE